MESAATVLDQLGIPATATTGNLDTLEQQLAAGDSIIVDVNGEQIWNSGGDTTQGDHAVVVAAIDEQNGIVYLSDSGTQSGNMEQVSLDTFMQAWGTSDYQMVTCDESAAQWQSEHQQQGDQQGQGDQQSPVAPGMPGFPAAETTTPPSGLENLGDFVAQSGWTLLPIALDLGRAVRVQ
jgi:hypothetical protein